MNARERAAHDALSVAYRRTCEVIDSIPRTQKGNAQRDLLHLAAADIIEARIILRTGANSAGKVVAR